MDLTARQRVGCCLGVSAISFECHQQQGMGVMIWAGTIEDRLVCPLRVSNDLKVASASCCKILKGSFLPWLDDLILLLRCNFIFMHNNVLSYSARSTKAFLASLGINGEKLMDWLLC